MNARKTFGTRLALPAMLLALCSACGEGTPTAPASGLAPASTRISAGIVEAGTELPFDLDATAVIVRQDPAPGFGPPEFGRSDFDGRCTVPSDLLLGFALDGEATYLGGFAGTVEHCTRIDFQTGGITIDDGVMILAAANGDELHATYGGESTPTGTEEHMVFDGGTGRFASASGEAIGRPACDQAAGTCVFTLEGVITFDASDTGGQ